MVASTVPNVPSAPLRQTAPGFSRALSHPVIAVARNAADFDDALRSPVTAIELRAGNLLELPHMMRRAEEARKSVFIYPELIPGLSKDTAGIEFLCDYAKPFGVVSTKRPILQKAKSFGLFTIFQIFMIDTQAYETGLLNAAKLDCDAVEIMPGPLVGIVRGVAAELSKPIICAGLIKTQGEIESLLEAGAAAVATSRRSLWFANRIGASA